MRIIATTLLCLSLFVSVGLYRLNHLNSIPVHVDNYSTYNLAEIYVLGIVMSVFGYPFYPEASIHHLSLYWKDKPDMCGNFFITSKVVQRAINNYKKTTMLAWSSKDYMFGNDEARVALAFNGAVLIKDRSKVVVRVPIRYPKDVIVKLLPFVEIQEGLFWVLQQKGWYHAGTLDWVLCVEQA